MENEPKKDNRYRLSKSVIANFKITNYESMNDYLETLITENQQLKNTNRQIKIIGDYQFEKFQDITQKINSQQQQIDHLVKLNEALLETIKKAVGGNQ